MVTYSKSRFAFTLIELLVVIAIISLLVSILLPALTTAKELARKSACAVQMRSIGIACHLYAADGTGLIPQSVRSMDSGIGSNPAWIRGFGTGYTGRLAIDLYGTYIDDCRLFYCPSITTYRAYDGIYGWNSTDSRYGRLCVEGDTNLAGLSTAYFYNSAKSMRRSDRGVAGLGVTGNSAEPIMAEFCSNLTGQNIPNHKPFECNTLLLDGSAHWYVDIQKSRVELDSPILADWYPTWETLFLPETALQ